jgi:hypothetical protein
VSEPAYILKTIPPGSIIRRSEQDRPDSAVVEWEEPDGSLHVMRITEDLASPVGVGVRVDEFVTTVAPDCKLTVGPDCELTVGALPSPSGPQ